MIDMSIKVFAYFNVAFQIIIMVYDKRIPIAHASCITTAEDDMLNLRFK